MIRWHMSGDLKGKRSSKYCRYLGEEGKGNAKASLCLPYVGTSKEANVEENEQGRGFWRWNQKGICGAHITYSTREEHGNSRFCSDEKPLDSYEQRSNVIWLSVRSLWLLCEKLIIPEARQKQKVKLGDHWERPGNIFSQRNSNSCSENRTVFIFLQ